MAFHTKGVNLIHLFACMRIHDVILIFYGFREKGQILCRVNPVAHNAILMSLSGKGGSKKTACINNMMDQKKEKEHGINTETASLGLMDQVISI